MRLNRFCLSLLASALLGGAAHAASLNLGGRYGNASGCKGDYSAENDDMLTLEDGAVSTFATACEFLQVLPASDGSRVVTGLCSHEGETMMTVAMMRIEKKAEGDAYLVYDGDGTLWGEVAKCQ